jgi:hypothetical protein
MAVLIASRQTAKVILRPWRREKPYGWILLGVAIGLAVLQTATLDPFGHRVMSWWAWEQPRTSLNWAGAPLTLFLDSAVLATVLLVLVTAWFIPKRPAGVTLDFEPVIIWLVMQLGFSLGDLRGGLWLPGAVGLASAGAVGWLAWRGRLFSLNSQASSGGVPASAA